MAGNRTGFITGANAKLEIFDGTDATTIAYVNNLSYAVDTITAPVESFGRYEVHANEPIAYGVSGGFSVLRYTAAAFKSSATDALGVQTTSVNKTGIVAIGAGVESHLDPSKMLLSATFDLTVSVKHTNAAHSTAESQSFFKLKDCKITGRQASLNKRGLLIDSYSFVF